MNAVLTGGSPFWWTNRGIMRCNNTFFVLQNKFGINLLKRFLNKLAAYVCLKLKDTNPVLILIFTSPVNAY